jgi:hypothetical protein
LLNLWLLKVMLRGPYTASIHIPLPFLMSIWVECVLSISSHMCPILQEVVISQQ